MISNYLNILEESLRKKIKILDHIQEVNHVQTEALKKEPMDMESFDRCADEKDIYIEQLEELDAGFESLYEKIKQELKDDKAKYAETIHMLQELIADITDKSVSIQAQESRNKEMVTHFFKQERKNMTKKRRSSKAAYGYYQNMNQPDEGQSFFMDTKK